MASRGAKYRIEGEDATGAAFKSVMGRAQKTANQISGFFRVAFAGISIAAIANLGREAIQTGDDLEKARVRAKLTAEEMSSLAHAAKLADVELSALSTSIQKMQIFMSKAESGGKEQAKTLKAIGLEVKDIINLNADEQFERIAEQVSRLAKEEDRARAVTEIFGKAGGELLPMFQNGARGIREARIEAEKLGLVYNDEQLKRLADADDAIKRMNASWDAMWVVLMAKVAPAVTAVANEIAGIDTRPLNERIASLEAELEKARGGRLGFRPAVGPIPFLPKYNRDPAEVEAELRRLRVEQEFGPLIGGGGRGGIRGQGSSVAPGFAATEAGELAEAARAKEQQAREDFLESERDTRAELARDAKKHSKEMIGDFLDAEQEKLEAAREGAERLRLINEEMSKEMSDNAQIFKDSFLNAWDDMVNTGKFKWDELLKYMLAEFARRNIVNLFDSLFAGSKYPSAGGGGGGFFGSIFGGIGKIFGGGLFGSGSNGGFSTNGIGGPVWLPSGGFGGGRAKGGSVRAGKIYEFNENGQELFAPGMDGTVIPNHALGGSPRINVTNNIHAPGATVESVKAMQRMLEASQQSTIAKIMEGLRRRKWAF